MLHGIKSRLKVIDHWLQSPDYCYNYGNISLFGTDNILTRLQSWESYSDIQNITKTNIINNWNSIYADRFIALIDRENKRILFNNKFDYYKNEILYRAKQLGYTIFEIDKDARLSVYNIFDDDHFPELIEHCVKFLIHELFFSYAFETIYDFILHGRIKLHVNIDDTLSFKKDKHFNSSMYRRIDFNFFKNFVLYYHVDNADYFNKTIDLNNYRYSYAWHYFNKGNTRVPTINDICKKLIINKREVRACRLRWFYTHYCYGYGIPYKFIENYYEKPYDENVFYNMIHKSYIIIDYKLEEKIKDNAKTMNDAIIICYEYRHNTK